MIFNTTEELKGKKKHSHLIYASEDTLQMNNGDHQHPLVYDEEGNLIVGAGGKDDHTHEVVGELEGGELKPEKKTDEDTISKVISSLCAAHSLNNRSIRQALDADRMINGFQWGDADIEKLGDEERACLTFNFIERKLDSLSGTQRLNRSMSQYAPEEGGDQFIADIYNVVLKNIARGTDWDTEETEIFEDASGPGMGVYDIYVDTDDNIEGKVVVERFDWKDIYFGPHRKIDGSDCEFFVKRKLITFDRLESEYPEKAKEIKDMSGVLDNGLSIFGTHKKLAIKDYPLQERHDRIMMNDIQLADIKKQEILLLELNLKVYKRKHTVAYPKENFFLAYEGLSQKTVSMLKDIPGVAVIEQPTNWVQRTKIAGSTILEDEILSWPTSQEPIKQLHTVPVYTKKRDDFWHGKVYSVTDIQKLLNKVQSLIADHAARSVSATTYFTGETFAGLPSEEENFKEGHGKAGLLSKIANMNDKPQREEVGKIPSDLFGYQQTLVSWMDTLMAVDESPQSGGRAESGKALQEKERIGLKANERIFDNMDKSRRLVVKHIARFIQEYYTPARIVRIVGQDILSDDPTVIQGEAVEKGQEPTQEDGQEVSAEEMFQIKLQEIANMLQEKDLLKNDLAVVNSPYSQTQREAVFNQMMTLASQGVDIPQSILAEMSNWPQKIKNQLLKVLAAQAKAQADADKAKNQTEIAKTVLANSGNE